MQHCSMYGLPDYSLHVQATYTPFQLLTDYNYLPWMTSSGDTRLSTVSKQRDVCLTMCVFNGVNGLKLWTKRFVLTLLLIIYYFLMQFWYSVHNADKAAVLFLSVICFREDETFERRIFYWNKSCSEMLI